MTKPRIYIAGPMTGLPEFNYPAFNAAAAAWRADGWDVVNPAEEHDGKTDLPYEEYVKVDIPQIASCDALAVLPGWNGKGARGSVWERYIAEYIYKIPIFAANTPFPAVDFQPKKEETALEEAHRIVNGARQKAYGHPLDDFSKTAKMWEGIIGVPITPEQIALCMIAVKISRLRNTPDHRDSIVDIAGYTATYEMVQTERKRRGDRRDHDRHGFNPV
jgi:hypothetical protein